MAPDPAPLSKLVALAADRAIAADSRCATFVRLKPIDSISIRRYFVRTPFAEREILVWRDKHWTKEGGTIHVELSCLPPIVQTALHGVEQSLEHPDYANPFGHFQFSLRHSRERTTWDIRTAEHASVFEREFQDWLAAVAMPWFEGLDSMEGVLSYCLTHGDHLTAAKLLAHVGPQELAREELVAYFAKLPRQIDRPLEALEKRGLIDAAERSFLQKASIQSEDEYRRRIGEWSARAVAPSHD